MKLEVLIVDEDDVILFIHDTIAKKSGLDAQPVLCGSGKDAFNYLKIHDDDINIAYLLLLDINMPEMTGWQLLDIINEQKFATEIFVIIVTSSVNQSDQEKAKAYKKVIDFRVKPLTLDGVREIKQLKELKKFFGKVSQH